jgi:predicted nucleotidyltransferase
MRRAQLIDRIHRLLAADPRVLAVYLFGSRGRGDERADSDVDVGVLFANRPSPRLDGPAAELESKLENDLGLPVQLVALNTAPPDLVHRVLRDGEIVCDAEPARRIRFEVKARNEYFDLLPFLNRYRKAS